MGVEPVRAPGEGSVPAWGGGHWLAAGHHGRLCASPALWLRHCLCLACSPARSPVCSPTRPMTVPSCPQPVPPHLRVSASLCLCTGARGSGPVCESLRVSLRVCVCDCLLSSLSCHLCLSLPAVSLSASLSLCLFASLCLTVPFCASRCLCRPSTSHCRPSETPPSTSQPQARF